MSINHYSADQIPESHLYWSPYTMDSSSPNHGSAFATRFAPKPTNFWSPHGQFCRYPGSSAVGGGSTALFNLSNEEEEEEEPVANGHAAANEDAMMESGREQEMVSKESLFEKPLTPSDVGKLNRLVIPKQHAEKYFPLSGGDSGEKGFLLCFEDEVGKAWRFRYSYWNSSQSYVLTKGWSRFVKEKRLDAGDFVLFSRHRLDTSRLFIGWRRRNSGLESGGRYNRGIFYHQAGMNPHPNQLHQANSYNPYQPAECHHAVQTQTASATSGSTTWKKLRLFGVNLECQLADESEPSTPTESTTTSYCSAVSSHGGEPNHPHHLRHGHGHWNSNYQQYYSQLYTNVHQSQTDHNIKFSLGDAGYHR